MSNRLKRSCVKRIDYKILDSIGEKVQKDCTTQFIAMNEEKAEGVDQLENSDQIKATNDDTSSEGNANSVINKVENQQLLKKYFVLKDEINDLIDENPINQSLINHNIHFLLSQ